MLLKPRFPLAVIAVSMVLVLPALHVGWALDDYYQRWLLLGSPKYPEFGHPPLDMFDFSDGNPQRVERGKEIGFLPWWSSPNLRAAFWKPLTAFTHLVDYTLWPNSPWTMHLHSIVWFCLFLGSVALLYRQTLGRTIAAALATLLFTIDGAHAIPAAWLANRNAVLAAFFGVLTVSTHLGWRRDGRKWCAAMTPILLAASLLSAEAGLGTCAYVFAYEVTLSRDRWRRKFGCLLPYAMVVVVWRIAWSWQHYGVVETGLFYLDPLTDPLGFIGSALMRIPILLLGQWALPPAEINLFLSSHGIAGLALAGFVVLSLLTMALLSLLRTSAVARFWAVGMLLSTLPIAAAVPMNRHLLLTGIGAMGLLGQYLAAAMRARFWHVTLAKKIFHAVLISVMSLIHLVLAPLVLVVMAAFPLGPPQFLGNMHVIPGVEADEENRNLLIVNHPLPMQVQDLLSQRIVDGDPLPRSTVVLAPASTPLSISRPDADSLLVHAEEGYFTDPLSLLGSSVEHPLPQSSTVALPAVDITVRQVSADGRPVDVLYRFKAPLEDRSLHWVCWQAGRFIPFIPPKIGETCLLPAARQKLP
ncbi:MAG TPA: hypothetical protein VFE46_07175 [Pirellulales bacterium]|jgi:hypothetical protein|nr:hypothetical protein [Pirellulales bacterium]